MHGGLLGRQVAIHRGARAVAALEGGLIAGQGDVHGGAQGHAGGGEEVDGFLVLLDDAGEAIDAPAEFHDGGRLVVAVLVGLQQFRHVIGVQADVLAGVGGVENQLHGELGGGLADVLLFLGALAFFLEGVLHRVLQGFRVEVGVHGDALGLRAALRREGGDFEVFRFGGGGHGRVVLRGPGRGGRAPRGPGGVLRCRLRCRGR